MSRSTNPKHFLNSEEEQLVTVAIAEAEARTAAEIKLVITRYCWGDIRDKARRIFYKHGLHKTAQRNAVLILLILTNRELLIFGDKGITEKVGINFWVEARETMLFEFGNDKMGEGIRDGIRIIGDKLATFFPHQGPLDYQLCRNRNIS